ncbi:12221_t:CDS:1, partial [Entrophospora sp. SA101]
APLTVSKNSSLEVILELFKKLGLRYVCVTENGQYVGVIHKKWLLRYLKEMEGKKEDLG